MNRKIGMAGAAINLCAVTAFALCMIIGTNIGSYYASIFIAIGFVPLICALTANGSSESKAAGYTAMVFSAMYASFILLVYFAQLTTVSQSALTGQAAQIINYQKFGLFFNYDLLGYGFMSLSTFFAGLTIDAKTKSDKWLKALLLVHGVFFITCFVLPLLGLFTEGMEGANWIGTAVLEFWCMYFIPVGILSFIHLKKKPL